MRALNFIGKALLAVVALLVVAGVGFYLSDPVYHGRILRLPFINVARDVDFYKPLEVLRICLTLITVY